MTAIVERANLRLRFGSLADDQGYAMMELWVIESRGAESVADGFSRLDSPLSWRAGAHRRQHRRHRRRIWPLRA